MYTKKIDWKEYQKMTDELAVKIKNSNEFFDGIYGIPRGGLPLAVSLSHILQLPILLYPTINSLVVDDISETGLTLTSHKNKKIACLFSTTWTTVKPDFYISTKDDENCWLIFPWEKESIEIQGGYV